MMRDISVDEAARMGVSEGLTASETGEEYGFSSDWVRRAAKRNGLTFPKDRTAFEQLRRSVETMRPSEAVETLLFVVSEILDAGAPEICVWPGVHLTGIQLELCRVLFRNEGKVCSYDLILASLYPGANEPPASNVIKVYATHLRKKLRATDLEITNVWGVGYRIDRKPGAVMPWEAADVT